MTNGEISRRLGDLAAQMAHGFTGVNVRIEGLTEQVRETNGRVLTLENQQSGEVVKVRNLEREVFDRPEEDRPLKRRELNIALWVAAGIVGLLQLIPWLLRVGHVVTP